MFGKKLSPSSSAVIAVFGRCNDSALIHVIHHTSNDSRGVWKEDQYSDNDCHWSDASFSPDSHRMVASDGVPSTTG